MESTLFECKQDILNHWINFIETFRKYSLDVCNWLTFFNKSKSREKTHPIDRNQHKTGFNLVV